MGEQEEDALSLKKPEINEQPEPIGPRVLGEIDPTTLSEEQFNNNPNILYHGAARPFKFVPHFDYASEEYCRDNDGSQTLGAGFYITPSYETAENYSRIRQGKEKINPFVIRILPYRARVFDFRSKDDLTKNAPVPPDFFYKWYKQYEEYYLRDGKQDLPVYIQEMEDIYWRFLNRVKNLIDSGEEIDLDLRVMLGTAPSPSLQSPNWPSPPYMELFSNFMKNQGFDGLVYIEGEEGDKEKSSPTYVFYNLERVGTYDCWQSRKK